MLEALQSTKSKLLQKEQLFSHILMYHNVKCLGVDAVKDVSHRALV